MTKVHSAAWSGASSAMGLRERKKLRTRITIRQAAYRLFEERGYEATTIDQIADAADVSPSTFFRYFPSKEELVTTDEFDPIMEDELGARPAGEPWLTSMRVMYANVLGRLSPSDVHEFVTRVQITEQTPSLRARAYEDRSADIEKLLGWITSRHGGSPDDLELRTAIGAFTGALHEAIRLWARNGGHEDLTSVVDRTIDVLEAGIKA